MDEEKPLTPRELEILKLTAKGLERDDIAEVLGIAATTVAGHKKRILKKLGVHNAAEAVYEAFQLGILSVEK